MKNKVYLKMFAGMAAVALVLVMATGALAAVQNFTVSGLLEVNGGYSVGGVEFVVGGTATCDDGVTAPVPLCSAVDLTLAPWAGAYVTVTGTYEDTADPIVRTASTIVLVDPADPAAFFTHQGVLTAFVVDTSWTIDGMIFWVDGSTIVPEFYALGDVVEATYTLVDVDADTVLDNLASEFVVLEFNGTYEFEGELMSAGEENWVVGPHTFLLNGLTPPEDVMEGDTVKVTFVVNEDGDFVATVIEVTDKMVPEKVDSARCDNRTKEHPALAKLADKVGAEYEDVLEMFCNGFGVGEIMLAYKYADGSSFIPRELLAERAAGLGWGQIKKMAAENPAEEGTEETGEGASVEADVKITGKPENSGKPENTGKPEKAEKSNNGKGKNK